MHLLTRIIASFFVICVRRIVFCLDVHNEAVKSMRYPPDAYKKEVANAGKEPGDDEKTIDELIQEMEDDMDEL